MFDIRLITIFCLCFVVYVHSESDFCCVKHKYVQDSRGFYIKKCVLGTTCSGGNENNYIFDEDYLAAQQNYVEQLKQSQNYDENFQNYIKDNEDFLTFLHNYVTRGKTIEKYNTLVNKYQQLEDEYTDYIKETFANDDKVEENLNIDRKRRSVDRGQVNKQNSYNLDEDYLLARRNHQGNLKNDDDKFQNVIKNKDLQNYVTGVKTMDKYTSLLNKYKQLQAGCNNHDKVAFPSNDHVAENPDEIDTESEGVDEEYNYILDEDYLVTQQNHLEKLREYVDKYQNYDAEFQNFIKNYETYVKELQNYVRGVKTTDKYTKLIYMRQQLDNEYNNYVKENFPKSDKVEENQNNNTQVNYKNNYIFNKEYLVAQQNYLKKLKEYADEHQIYDSKFQNYIKHNEDLVNDLQHFVTGAKTTETYTSLLNKYQQLKDEYDDYIKQNFSNGDKVEENVNIGRNRRSADTAQVNNQPKYILDENTLSTQQNFLVKLKDFTDNYLKYDEKLENFVKNYDYFVKELQNYVTGVKTTDKYTSLIYMHQQLTEEYNNYVKENFPKSEEVEENQNNIDTEDKSGDNTNVNQENKYIINKEHIVAQQNFVKQLKEYADEHQIDEEKFQNYIKMNENYVKELQDYVTGKKTQDKYTNLIKKHQQLQEYNYVKKYFSNSDKVDVNKNIIASKRRSVESEEYTLYDKINPDATAYEKCLWKYKQYGSTVCDQLKSLAYWEKLGQVFPFRDSKEYNSVVDKMEDDRDMDDEDNKINVLGMANGKITNQNQRIDSLLTAAPNCFEGRGSLAHNNLCKLEFYDY